MSDAHADKLLVLLGHAIPEVLVMGLLEYNQNIQMIVSLYYLFFCLWWLHRAMS